MKTLKALLLSFVFVLISSFSFAEVGMKFNYFGATACKTEGNTWEAFMLTDVVTTSEVPVKDVTIFIFSFRPGLPIEIECSVRVPAFLLK